MITNNAPTLEELVQCQEVLKSIKGNLGLAKTAESEARNHRSSVESGWNEKRKEYLVGMLRHLLANEYTSQEIKSCLEGLLK